jgi:glycine cleavage system H lipoate-binding protein
MREMRVSHFDIAILADKTIRLTFSSQAKEEFRTAQCIEFPEIGKKIRQQELLLAIESSKAIFELESPVDGRVIEVHNSKHAIMESYILLEPINF